MSASSSPQARTRAFARLIGPFLAIVPTIIAVRMGDMFGLERDFFASQLFIWFTGAFLLAGGLVIIAFHQYWRSLAAVLISLFGWMLALRGLTLLIAPRLYQQAGQAMSSVPLVQAFFGLLALIGLYLAYVGWLQGGRVARER